MDADVSRRFLFEQVESNVPEDSQVLWTVVLANSAFIFPKGDIEHPM